MGRTVGDPGGWETGAETFLDVLLCEDVSEGGVAVRVSHDFEGCRIDDPVKLILTLPGKPPLTLAAHVRHIADLADVSIFGVEFDELDRSNAAAIAAYVNEMIACGRIC